MSAELVIGSPKQSRSAFKGWQGFFPYYAGYPTGFAEAVISSARLGLDATVMDPWNGSGTTTFAAANLGINSIGLDLNAVMVVVARARLLSPLEASSLPPLALELSTHIDVKESVRVDSDPLNQWFEKETANEIRSVERLITRSLIGARIDDRSRVDFSSISPLCAAFYVALFTVARAASAQFKASNPTWLRVPRKNEKKITLRPGAFRANFLSTIEQMAIALKRSAEAGLQVDFADSQTLVADSTTMEISPDSIDFVLTSPPYCTRLDYTAATRIELALLAPLLEESPEELSRKMIGSTKVPRKIKTPSANWGSTCLNFLNAVEQHHSKASSGYYLKTHVDYFDKMDRSIEKISLALKPGGRMLLVVQDSYYKDVHNDLPKIISEMTTDRGLILTRREDFYACSSSGILRQKAA